MTALQVPTPFYPTSKLSSRAPSPAPHPEKTAILIVEPGTQPEYVYDNVLPAWRASIRRVIVQSLHRESEWIGAMQKLVRRPWLDTYFVYTSTLGTHTFFMTVLPAVFFFGQFKTGRGLVHILSAGVYASTFTKDLICSPRPFTPPVTRLTIGNHHLEYGFPSTHSTNSLSVALYIFCLCQSLPEPAFSIARAALLFYVFSIIYGRLYCAMHSFSDCIMGCILGTAVWAAQWNLQDGLEALMATRGPLVPLIVIPAALFLINQHPEPVDDCPCFEDSIAFVSVVMGTTLGRWHAVNYGLDEDTGFYVSRTPGWQRETIQDYIIWTSFALLKMVVGVLLIFLWRLVMKTVMLTALPPLYRFISQGITLPNRRFYTPATQYKSVPQENGLHPIPSVIDLPSTIEPTDTARLHASLASGSVAKQRVSGSGKEKEVGEANGKQDLELTTVIDRTESVKHYDASVITKVVVYAGIGWIATEWIPVMFELLGWGVKSTWHVFLS